MKENVSLRIYPHVKRILDEMCKKEFRPLANMIEKLLYERLRDLGYLDDKFQPVKKK